jgi:hypothetical protein
MSLTQRWIHAQKYLYDMLGFGRHLMTGVMTASPEAELYRCKSLTLKT